MIHWLAKRLRSTPEPPPKRTPDRVFIHYKVAKNKAFDEYYSTIDCDGIEDARRYCAVMKHKYHTFASTTQPRSIVRVYMKEKP